MTIKKDKGIPKAVLIAAIAGIVVLEGIALWKGIDGWLLSVGIAAIAGIAGWALPQLKTK